MVGLAPEPLPTDLRQLAARRPANPVPFVQGFYYVLVGLAPVLAGGSFRASLGPDADPGLLRAFGLVVAAAGGVLLAASRRPGVLPETGRLAVAAAVVLAVADVAFVLAGIVPTLYLLDAIAQVVFVSWWVKTLLPDAPLFTGRVGPMALA